jgi:hypothetical protein
MDFVIVVIVVVVLLSRGRVRRLLFRKVRNLFARRPSSGASR